MSAILVTAHPALVADDHLTEFRYMLAVRAVHSNRTSTSRISMSCLDAMGRVAIDTDVGAEVEVDQSLVVLLEAMRHTTILDFYHDTRMGTAAFMATVHSPSVLKAAILNDNTNDHTIKTP